MALEAQAGGVDEGMVSQSGIGNQVRPLHDLYDASKLSLKLVDPPATVRRCPPCACVDV
jgi:hypothetical protein